MASCDLWKYCTEEQVKETLLSLGLLDGLSIKEDRQLACLYAVSNHVNEHYHIAEIPKRSGGTRRLFVPDGLLCTIQKNILRHVLEDIPVSDYATAYRAKVSVTENAKPHVGAEQILKLDIKNFFDNISFSLVYQYAFPPTYFPSAIRMLLASLCCCEDYLPQGAPTSPAVSNIVMRPFDEYMGKWCGKRGIHYTRYCDDMTFSGAFDVKEVKNKVRGYLLAYGLELNEKKTKVQRKHGRQIVTGIVVNERPQVSRNYRRLLRAEIYYCRKYGPEEHLAQTGKSEWISTGKLDTVKYLQHLLGKVNYVLLVNPQDRVFIEARQYLRDNIRKTAMTNN